MNDGESEAMERAPRSAPGRSRRDDLASALAARRAALGPFECIAVAGSLARGEETASSDADCVLVVRAGTDDAALARAAGFVWEAVQSIGLRVPRADSLFRDAVTAAQLLDPRAAGALDETPSVYGKRLQLLTDTAAVFAAERFGELRLEVLQWFVRWQPSDTPLAFLASELIRYRRSYCAYQRFCFAHDDTDSWHLRMAKLGSSRLLTVAGLLFLLGEAGRQENPVSWVAQRLDLSPLARTLDVMGRYAPHRAERVSTLYSAVQSALGAARVRDGLLASGPVSQAHLEDGSVPLGYGLDELLVELSRELNEFLLRRQGDWPGWFFRALLL
jgi:predicted nucleotidyltransferase